MLGIDVCICTFKRNSIVETLETIARQSVRGAVDLHVLVADNDAAPTAAEQITAVGTRLGIPLTYIHAPARNISIARNACLDAARSDWIAFIDDDEVAPHDWLARLLDACDDIDVRFGRSQALYDPAMAPSWMVAGDFHSNRIEGNDASHNGYTCNVLMRRDFVEQHGLRFDLALGQTGGEDTLFFEQANRAGGRFDYMADAVVYEAVPASRATLGWLMKRRFRAGQIHRDVLQTRGTFPLRAVPGAIAKISFCGAAALANIARSGARERHLLRAALHLGFLSSAFGARTYQEYSAGPPPPG